MKKIIIFSLFVFCVMLSGCSNPEESHDERILTVLNAQNAQRNYECTVQASTTLPTSETELAAMLGTWNENRISSSWNSAQDGRNTLTNLVPEGLHLVTIGFLSDKYKFGMATFDKWGCATIDYNAMQNSSERTLTVCNAPCNYECSVYPNSMLPSTKAAYNIAVPGGSINTIATSYWNTPSTPRRLTGIVPEGPRLVVVQLIDIYYLNPNGISYSDSFKYGLATFDKWSCAIIDFNTMQIRSALLD